MDAVVAAAVAGIFAVIVAVIQIRVHRDNRKDHGANASVLAEIRDDVRDVKADMQDIKAEVRTLKEEVRWHSARIDKLEM